MERLFHLLRLLTLALLAVPGCKALDLSVGPGDVRVEATPGGFVLHVRKKPDIASVLLTEDRTRVPAGQPVYSLRTRVGTAEGGEKRVLDGRELDNLRIGSLVDSTVDTDSVFGREFRIIIPPTLVFGYPPGRHGEMNVRNGTTINIRTFEKPYADYSGKFKDNTLVVSNQSGRTPAWAREIAEASGGRVEAPDTLAGLTTAALESVRFRRAGPIDVVFCIDTTEAMSAALAELQRSLVPALEKVNGPNSGARFGIVYYRDYLEEYLTRTVPFQRDLNALQRSLDLAQASGGRGSSDAVYEALRAATEHSAWRPEARKMVILICGLPPHPDNRGIVSQEETYRAATAAKIVYDVIAVPKAER